jgi:hypothetical protein
VAPLGLAFRGVPRLQCRQTCALRGADRDSPTIPVQVVDMAAMKTWPRESLGGARLGKKKVSSENERFRAQATEPKGHLNAQGEQVIVLSRQARVTRRRAEADGGSHGTTLIPEMYIRGGGSSRDRFRLAV